MKTMTGLFQDLGRRDLFRTAGAAAIGGLVVAMAPNKLTQMAHANENAHEESDAEKLTIELGDLFFRAEGQAENAPIELHAGERYDITFRNVGAAPHEVMIGRVVANMDGRPHGYETNFLDVEEVKYAGRGWEIEAFGLNEIELEAGEETRIVFEVPGNKAGEWELGCFVPGHYEAGMKAPLMVMGHDV